MTLNIAALRTRLDAAGQAELTSLSRETDPGLAAESWLNFAQRQEAAGRLEAAAEIYSELAGGNSPLPSAIPRRARERLEVLLGRGSFGGRFEFLARNFAREASDPAMLLGMGAAATVSSMVRLGMLSRLLASPSANLFTRGAGARWLAASAAFLPEVGAFWGASRATRAALGGPDQAWDLRSVTREWASLGLSLGLLKLGGWASRGLFDRLHGVDALSGGVARLPAFTRWSRPLLENLGMFSGIALAHGLEPRLGLAPERGEGSFWTDSLATLLQFHVGGRLSRELLGPRHAALLESLAIRTRALEASPPEADPALAPIPALAMAGGPAAPRPLASSRPEFRWPTVFMAQSLETLGGTRASAPAQPPASGVEPAREARRRIAITRLVVEERITALDPDFFQPERRMELLSRARKCLFNRSERARLQHAIRRYLNEERLPSFSLDHPLVRERLGAVWRNNPPPSREALSPRYRAALESIHEAREILASLAFADGNRLEPSAFRHSPALSQALGVELFYLNDAGRETGSFKERGALVEVRRAALAGALHVVTASHGNHGLAVAMAADRLGLRSTIVVPDTTPRIKIQRLQGLGADVVTTGKEPWRGYEEARDWALRYVFERNFLLDRDLELRGVLRYVHGFEDVVPGQGVAAFEILEAIQRLPPAERERFSRATFLIPTGGGGLAAGVATVLRSYLPEARVIAVVSTEAPAMHFSLIEGRRSEVFLNEKGLCDSGIGLTIPGYRPFELLRETLDGSLAVSDPQVAEAMRLIHRGEGLVVEGGAATGVAAVMSGRLQELGHREGSPVVTIFTGGNIDLALRQAVLLGSGVPANGH